MEDRDWKVEINGSDFTVTDVASGAVSEHSLKSFEYVHNSLVKMVTAASEETIQFLGSSSELNYGFYYQGGKVNTMVYDEHQYKFKHLMAPPTKIDYSRSVMSPMPGAIINVSVVAG